jgi:hypothetical protein
MVAYHSIYMVVDLGFQVSTAISIYNLYCFCYRKKFLRAKRAARDNDRSRDNQFTRVGGKKSILILTEEYRFL